MSQSQNNMSDSRGRRDNAAQGNERPGYSVLLTRQEAAAYLGVSCSKFDQLREQYNLPVVEIARGRYHRPDLDNLIVSLKSFS